MCYHKIRSNCKKFLFLWFFILLFFLLFINLNLLSCGLVFQSNSNEELFWKQFGNIADTDKKNLNLNSSKNEKFAKVAEIVDGDTLIVDLLLDGQYCIRLIGINAPEKDTFFYKESKEFLSILIKDKIIRLEKDITEKDVYGRLLRYVYLGDLFINLEMVKKGFANSFTLPPDVKYQKLFIEAERIARENALGLWQLSKYSGSFYEKKYTLNKSTLKDNSINKNNHVSNYYEQSDDENFIIFINSDANGNDNKNLNGEFVKIINNSGFDINIKGWTIKDSSINIYKFKNYLFLKGSYIILFSGEGIDKDNIFYWNSKKPIWNNYGDTLYLRDEDGYLVSIYSY